MLREKDSAGQIFVCHNVPFQSFISSLAYVTLGSITWWNCIHSSSERMSEGTGYSLERQKVWKLELGPS